MNNGNEYLYNIETIVNNKEMLTNKKNELELLLSESKIQLCSISLSQKQVETEYNRGQNYLNSANLQYLTKKHKEKELEIKKITDALDYIDKQINLTNVTKIDNTYNQNDRIDYNITDIKLFNNIDSNINYDLTSISIPSVGLISKIETSTELPKEDNNEQLDLKINELEKEINETMFDICSYKESLLNEQSYNKAYLAIKKLITLEILLEKYLGKSKTNERLIQLKENLKYSSARFISFREIDFSLYSKVLGLSLKIEYSLNPEEVVNAYVEREKIYNQNNKNIYSLPQEYLDKLNKNDKHLEVKSDLVYNTDPKKIELEGIVKNLKTLGIEVTDEEIKEIKDLLS